jgi:rod shape determining protein RodA
MINKDSFNKVDMFLLVTVIFTISFGILMIYSAGFDPVMKVNSGLYKKQIIWFIIGIIFFLVMTTVNYRQLNDYAMHIYGFLIFAIILTLLFGKNIRGTTAWLSFGYFSIQPAEFMKLGVVIVLAKYLEYRERDLKKFKELLIPTVLTLVPVLLILKQPDFGTAAIFIPILFTMLFVGGCDVAHLVSIVCIAVIAVIFPMLLTYREWVGDESSNLLVEFFIHTDVLFSVAGIFLAAAITTFILNYYYPKIWLRRIYIPSSVVSLGLFLSVVLQNSFQEYQKKRILVFLNPELDPFGSGYNIIQSKVAAGSGGFLGKGFLKGTQSQLGFLPETTSDFIFPIVAEELGFAGAVILLFLLGLIVFKGIQISLTTKDKFGSLLAIGITSIFFYHIIINIGVVLGIFPVTGIPLCFISYGGSNLFMAMIGIGILNNIKMNKTSY